jgi:hypothetical protein
MCDITSDITTDVKATEILIKISTIFQNKFNPLNMLPLSIASIRQQISASSSSSQVLKASLYPCKVGVSLLLGPSSAVKLPSPDCRYLNEASEDQFL